MHRVYGSQIYTLKQIPKTGISISELSRTLGVDVTTTNKQINSLELKGLINSERRRGPYGNKITLSKSGRKFLNEMVKRV